MRPPLLLEIRAQFLAQRCGLLPLRSDGGNGLHMLRRPRAPPTARRRGRRRTLAGHSERRKPHRGAPMLPTPFCSGRKGCEGRARRLPTEPATREAGSSHRTLRRDRHSDPQAALAANPCPCIEALTREALSRQRGTLGRVPNRQHAPNPTTAECCGPPGHGNSKFMALRAVGRATPDPSNMTGHLVIASQGNLDPLAGRRRGTEPVRHFRADR